MKLFGSSLIYAFLPKRCAFCGKVIIAADDVCAACKAEAPRILPPFCEKCGRSKADCSCRKRERFYSGIAAPFYFDGVVRHGVHRFKFRNVRLNAACYSREMAQTVSERYGNIKFDCILCVPMTDKRKKARGYNQSELLAEGISGLIGVPFCRDALKKLYETKAQHGLGRFLRRGNLTGVFDVSGGFNPQGKTILLCDDVSTSGETFDECAKMLYLRGAKETFCIALALTKMKNKL